AVDVDVEDAADGAVDDDARFFPHLSLRSGDQVGVAGLDVPPGLQPAAELRVADEEYAPALRAQHERAGGEVARRGVLARERIARRREQLAHARRRAGARGPGAGELVERGHVQPGPAGRLDDAGGLRRAREPSGSERLRAWA